MNRTPNAAAEPTAIAVAVVQRGGEFLIGRRPDGATLAGYWEFPGGKVAPYEKVEAAACRECLEETGLEVRVSGKYSSVEYSYPHGPVRLHFFACTPTAQQRPLPERFRWVAAAQLRAYRFPPANAALLEQLCDRADEPTARDASTGSS